VFLFELKYVSRKRNEFFPILLIFHRTTLHSRHLVSRHHWLLPGGTMVTYKTPWCFLRKAPWRLFEKVTLLLFRKKKTPWCFVPIVTTVLFLKKKVTMVLLGAGLMRRQGA